MKLGQGLPTRETSEIVTFSVSRKHSSLGICCQSQYSHLVSSRIAPTETNISLVRRRAVCLMINKSWCDHNNIQELKSFCSPDLEFLTIKCRLHYLPRELSLIVITVVYIPPKQTPQRPWKNFICKPETTYSKAVFIVAGDFNQVNLSTRLPKISILNARHKLVAFWTIATLKPSPTFPSANLTMTPFCCSQPIDRN